MELKTAIEILEYHQEWRLGKREDIIHEPKKLTEALEVVISEVKKLEASTNEKLSNEAQNPTLRKGDVMPCTFSDLEIGDKVQIKHYHIYKNGYWQSPSFIDYKYLGVKNGGHHFQNVNCKHEHFRMKKEFEDYHVFLGKYKA